MNQTIVESYQALSRDQITQVTQNPIIIGIFIAIGVLILLAYIIIAGLITIKVSNGRKVKLLSRINAWIPVFVWIIAYPGLVLLLLIFPVWVR